MKHLKKVLFSLVGSFSLVAMALLLVSANTNAATLAATDAENIKSFFEITRDAIRLLSVAIGAALVGSTIFAGIQYTTSGGDSGKVQKAKGRLASNVVVLVLYIFSATILNWILPS